MIIASIDIGTNTVLLLIAEVDNKKQLKTILNEYRIPRIGKGLLPGNPISEEKVNELLTVLAQYAKIITANNCTKVLVTATNAFRIASNQSNIAKLIKDRFNWNVNIVSGEDEAYLSYLGAISNFSEKEEIFVIDIGGGSTELIFGNGADVNYRKSYSTGVVSESERFFKNNPPLEQELQNFDNYLNIVFSDLSLLNYSLTKSIALAGTPTTLACMALNLEIYDEGKIEGHILGSNDIKKLESELSIMSNNEIAKNYKSVVKGREDLILAGCIILLKIMELKNISNIIVSTKGIRYGAIIKEFMRFE